MEIYSYILSIIIFVVYIFERYFFKPYSVEKAMNLAKIQDTSKITNIEEGIRNFYSLILENQKFVNQLKFAAIDKRLATHQEAYSLLNKLKINYQNIEVGKLVTDYQEWYYNNSLYLAIESRKAFLDAVNSVFIFISGRKISEESPDTWDMIIEAMKVIEKDTGYTDLGLFESEKQQI